MKVCLLKMGTVKQGRAWGRSSNKREPRLGCLNSLGSGRKEGLVDRFRALAQDKLRCPLLPWLKFYGDP